MSKRISNKRGPKNQGRRRASDNSEAFQPSGKRVVSAKWARRKKEAQARGIKKRMSLWQAVTQFHPRESPK